VPTPSGQWERHNDACRGATPVSCGWARAYPSDARQGIGEKMLGRWPMGQSGMGGFSLSGSDRVCGSGPLRK
jgi:hypothetical protein